MPTIPAAGVPLREVFQANSADTAATPVITLGTLATSIGCSVTTLVPLAEAGFLRLKSAPPLTSQSYVEVVPEAAVVWLRSWIQPVQAKPLFSAADLADLLEVTTAEVVKVAAQHAIPTAWEPGLGGFTFSVFAARQLILAVVQSRQVAVEAPRWDRQAMLWLLLEGDPEAAFRQVPLTYSEAIEKEITRTLSLEGPARSLRAAALIERFEDARRLLAAAAASHGSQTSSQPASQPGHDVPADEHASAKFARLFSQLRPVPAPSGRARP